MNRSNDPESRSDQTPQSLIFRGTRRAGRGAGAHPAASLAPNGPHHLDHAKRQRMNEKGGRMKPSVTAGGEQKEQAR